MSDFIGRIPVPEIIPSDLFFPIKPEYGSGVSIEPEVKTFQFQTGNAKVEQRFVLGNGYRKFSVSASPMPARVRIGSATNSPAPNATASRCTPSQETCRSARARRPDPGIRSDAPPHV